MNETHKMSVAQLTVLTAVSMMGSGIIMLPSKLAQVGGLSIVSWIVTALGSMCLAYAFAQCGMFSKRPDGLNGYAEYAFGKSGNFICGTTYSFSLVIANVAIAISAVGYGATLLGLDLNPINTCIYTIVVIWLTTIPNFGGAKLTGKLSSFTIWGVLIPIFVISTAGLFFFSGDMYQTNWNVHNLPFGEAATNAITMTLWSFLGLESACANADAVENPEKAVPRAVLGGTILCAIVYIISTNVIFGMLPAEEIVQSSAPFGLAFAYMFGPTIGKVVMGLMCIACLGSLMSWQFTVANVFKASSEAGYFPAVFKKVTGNGSPISGMIIWGIIQTLLSLMTISPSLNEQFEQIVNLAVITNLVPYILSMAAVTLIMKCAGKTDNIKLAEFTAVIGSIYSLYACYASGLESMTYGAIVTFLCWPLYGFIAEKYEMERAMNVEDDK